MKNCICLIRTRLCLIISSLYSIKTQFLLIKNYFSIMESFVFIVENLNLINKTSTFISKNGFPIFEIPIIFFLKIKSKIPLSEVLALLLVVPKSLVASLIQIGIFLHQMNITFHHIFT